MNIAHHEFRDSYKHGRSECSVELCQGTWHTFGRAYAGLGDPSVKAHASREDARTYAEQWAREVGGRTGGTARDW